MKKNIFLFLILPLVVAGGCVSTQFAASDQKSSYSVIQDIATGQIKNLPPDVFPEQIGSFYDSFLYPSTYSVGNNLYTLALEPSANYALLALRELGKPVVWHGILQSQDQGKTWTKFFTVIDLADSDQVEQTIKYNPVGVFSEDNKLFVDIVNDLGAGSGEGQLIRFSTSDSGKTWEQDSCYYFIPEKYYVDNPNGKITQIDPHQLEKTIGCLYSGIPKM